MATGLPSRERRSGLLALLGVAISVVAVWLVARDVDLAETARIVGTAEPLFLLAAVGVVAVQAVLRAHRWRLLLPRPAGTLLRIGRVLPVMLVGYLGNALLPARLGEVVRAALLARRESVPSAETLGAAVLERIVDVLILAIFGVVAALLVAAPGWMIAAAVAGAVIAAGALAFAAVAGFVARRTDRATLDRPTRIGVVTRLAAQLGTGLRVTDRRATVTAAAGLTAVAWVLDATVFWLVARSLGIEVTPVVAVLVSAVTILSTAIPTAPGFVGTFELAAVAAIGAAGIAGEAALAFAVLAHLITLLPLSLAGAISLVAIGGGSLRELAFATPARRAP